MAIPATGSGRETSTIASPAPGGKIRLVLALLCIPAGLSAGQAPPAATYWVYVGAESADMIHRVRFGPEGAVVERTIGAGEHPTEMEGPHGLQISRDGRYLHMTTGHGSPDGRYWKYHLGPDTLAGHSIPLGDFPASIDVTPDGLYAFASNFSLYGPMRPSTISVIFTPTNTEVTRVTTCTMPHGSRVNGLGTRHYSTCMMDDQLVEIDATTFEVSRRFSLARGSEGPLDRSDLGHGAHPGMTMPPASCSPTWAQPSPDNRHVYVACNRSDEVLEVEVDGWAVTRRFATGRGPYNTDVTPDGTLLVVTLKSGSGVQLFDLRTGERVMDARSSTTVTHGIAISPDSRYAFISNEGVGAQPGKVDIYDLRARVRVAEVEVGQQAGGIAFWKMDPPPPPRR
jgi:hypothetical protein